MCCLSQWSNNGCVRAQSFYLLTLHSKRQCVDIHLQRWVGTIASTMLSVGGRALSNLKLTSDPLFSRTSARLSLTLGRNMEPRFLCMSSVAFDKPGTCFGLLLSRLQLWLLALWGPYAPAMHETAPFRAWHSYS